MYSLTQLLFVCLLASFCVCKKDQVTPEDNSVCKDAVDYCDSLEHLCHIKGYAHILKKRCAKTCRFCFGDDKCEDSPLLNCKSIHHQCAMDPSRMNRLCPRTCGACRVSAPPKCSASALGCCWDKVTMKKDTQGSNCPPCNDDYKNICKTFHFDCSSTRSAGSFMRRFCKKTCQMCNGSCRDHPERGVHCHYWKDQLNWCVKKPKVMRHYCQKSCDFC